MTAIQGTNVLSPVVPFDTADTNPTHDEQYGKGGYRTVATTTDRDAIPNDRCVAGMKVKVLSNGVIYTLKSGFSNPLLSTDWEVVEYVEANTENAYSVKENNTEYLGIDTTENDSGVRLFGNKVLNTLSPITTGDFETTDGLYYWLFDADTEQTGTYNGTSYGGIDLIINDGSITLDTDQYGRTKAIYMDVESDNSYLTTSQNIFGSTETDIPSFSLCVLCNKYAINDIASIFRVGGLPIFNQIGAMCYTNTYEDNSIKMSYLNPNEITYKIKNDNDYSGDEILCFMFLYDSSGSHLVLINNGTDFYESGYFNGKLTTYNEMRTISIGTPTASGGFKGKILSLVYQNGVFWDENTRNKIYTKLLGKHTIKDNQNNIKYIEDKKNTFVFALEFNDIQNGTTGEYFLPFDPTGISYEYMTQGLHSDNTNKGQTQGYSSNVGTASTYTKKYTNNGTDINDYNIYLSSDLVNSGDIIIFGGSNTGDGDGIGLGTITYDSARRSVKFNFTTNNLSTTSGTNKVYLIMRAYN